MSYEPRGKVKLLADAMAADPQRIWTSPEVANVMQVHQGALTAHLDTAVRNGAIFRKLVNGRCQYSPKPFPADAADIVVPTFTGFVPPKMTAPRAGSDVPHVNPPREPVPPAATAAPVPAPAPMPAPAVIAEESAAVEEANVEDEAVEFDFCVYRNGTVQVWGLQANDDGSVSISPEQLAELRNPIACMPPAQALPQSEVP